LGGGNKTRGGKKEKKTDPLYYLIHRGERESDGFPPVKGENEYEREELKRGSRRTKTLQEGTISYPDGMKGRVIGGGKSL